MCCGNDAWGLEKERLKGKKESERGTHSEIS